MIDYKYFLGEFNSFRDVMCSTKYTKEQKENALQGLMFVYIRMKPGTKEEESLAQSAIDMLMVEFPMRMQYEN